MIMPRDHDDQVFSLEEGVREMKIEEGGGDRGAVVAEEKGKKEEEEEEEVYPDRLGEPDCLFYLRTGTCRYGRNCRFNHPADPAKVAASLQSKEELPQRVGEPDCGFYLKTGTCKYGSACKYHHPRDRRVSAQVPLNNIGLPLRQEEKCCPYYMRTSMCKFGVACKFNHPQLTSIPSSMETAFAVPRSVGIDSLVSPILPPTGVAYVAGVSPWLLSKPQYMSDPRMAGAQTYVPFLFPPSQGIMTSHGWSTYVGSLNPTSATGLNLVPPTSNFGNNHAYNSKDQNYPGINLQANGVVANIALLPQRPGQPECRHFMSTGSCKYGADCKYHHPTERTSQLAMSSLGPHGLPLRPGETTCSDFSMYGICKYGPTCKFDHPISCYFSNFCFGMPYVPIVNQSSFPYPRNYFNTNPSETWPSTSRITEWIQKPDIAEVKNHNPDVKSPEDPQGQADDHSRPLQNASELPPVQSD
ncbi:Zinc finger CCCH domain-containing protein [Drosera capensis]